MTLPSYAVMNLYLTPLKADYVTLCYVNNYTSVRIGKFSCRKHPKDTCKMLFPYAPNKKGTCENHESGRWDYFRYDEVIVMLYRTIP
jgi:hypothetical protein